MSTERKIMDNSPGNLTPASPAVEVVGRGLVIQLPWPPSMNHYWRNVVLPARGKSMARTLLSSEGRKYRAEVAAEVKRQHPGLKPVDSRLSVQIVAMPPDRRKRDLDNLLKPTLDALQHAGVFADDGQIDDLHVKRAEVIAQGNLVVFISQTTDDAKQARLFR